MEKNEKGFTLIELLAVIVILGLLMAIAIPSITKYITQSRRKTLVTSINGYVSAIVNEVNDQNYYFSTPNVIFAVPIECIPLEKGGENPFGDWLQANTNYWAYVLVQYDAENFNYRYGFTFKDSSGYGMYPTEAGSISPTSSSQIVTGLNLEKPVSGLYSNIAEKDKWTGFDIQDDTELVVLVSESEGKTGDGKTTCTLCQKGDNYEIVEQEKEELENKKLNNMIKRDNTLITAKPKLTTSSNYTSDASGLYLSTATNSGEPTYYFRGNVTNNYVSFAGYIWRIIRINEDGTVRLILNGGAYSRNYAYNSNDTNHYSEMYYSNSEFKDVADGWYKDYILKKGYDRYVSYGMFCEQAKVKNASNWTSGKAVMTNYTSYTPNFKCATDGNGYGILNLKIGLITYDEVVFAGGYYNKNNQKYYLYKSAMDTIWTMSPAGIYTSVNNARVWSLYMYHTIMTFGVSTTKELRPVINLNANVTATGTGTSTDPYVVITE